MLNPKPSPLTLTPLPIGERELLTGNYFLSDGHQDFFKDLDFVIDLNFELCYLTFIVLYLPSFSLIFHTIP